jgi:hypothetical protein
MSKVNPDVEVVPADKYPELLPKSHRKQAINLLKSGETLAKAARIIQEKTAELRRAVLNLIEQMIEAAQDQDWATVFATVHEIRGLAATAGLAATGRIANGLCHYFDALSRFSLEPDLTVVQLHLDAIARSARTEDDAARHGEAVVEQLATLVARKLADINASKTL